MKGCQNIYEDMIIINTLCWNYTDWQVLLSYFTNNFVITFTVWKTKYTFKMVNKSSSFKTSFKIINCSTLWYLPFAHYRQQPTHYEWLHWLILGRRTGILRLMFTKLNVASAQYSMVNFNWACVIHILALLADLADLSSKVECLNHFLSC